jgi:prepilin-type processing-associated H-X9-DG protein
MPLAYASGDIDAFVEFLHVCHEHQAKSKKDNYLFSPAIFDPNKTTEKNRCKENILYLRHIVLDFEDGELKPDTLPKLFPDLQMVVTNTFNHTSDKPRFRAVLFTDEAMTTEAYGLIYNFIADKLEEASYSVERPGKHLKISNALNSRPSGLDWSKSLPTSLFYFPCQAQCPAVSFFMECMEGRNPLNPSTWIENTTVPLQPPLESVEPNIQVSRVDEKMVQSAISTWRTSPSHPGRGNVMFFDLALSLKYAGMAFPEIESTLRSEAQYARTPNERLAQIPSIMASLRVYSESWRDRTLAIEVPAA